MAGETQPQTAADEAGRGNVPGHLTRLVGRDEALGELRSLVWQTRLLTLCGTGGAGKTRLAGALAEALWPDFVGGSWWVDLSATLDPDLVAQAVVGTLLPDEPAGDATAGAIARLFGESSLLVLDNCEQVVEGCSDLAVSLLERASSLRIIATSRQPLAVPGERVWRVPGLAVDAWHSGAADTGHSGAADTGRSGAVDAGRSAAVDTGRSGAVELFIERARAVSSSFDPDAAGVLEAVTRICRCLDGVPLAIELAAARVPVLGVTQIAERLERDSGFLRANNRSAPARHQTLRATLDWSHRMLDDAERRLFRRLATFRGSFSLAAAEAVCADDSLAADEVLDLLGAMVDRSLVQVVEGPDHPRYQLLITVRQYALRHLQESEDLAATRERHARFFAGLAREADHAGLVERIELEHDNMSEALQWLLAHAADEAARLAALLWPFWYRRGYYKEARLWFDQILQAREEVSTPARAEALTRAGEVAFLQCDYDVAAGRLQDALALIEELGDRAAEAIALQRLGSIAREQGRYADATELHGRSLAIWHELDNPHGVAVSQNYLGFVTWLKAEPWANSQCSAALAEFQHAGDLQDAATALVNLGAIALYRGELALATERLEEALSIARKLGFEEGIAWAAHELAIASRRRRRPPREVASLLREALLIHWGLGDRWRVASVLEEVAGALLAREDPRQAVEVLGAADALRERLGTPIPPVEAPDYEAAMGRARAKLSPTAFEAMWSAGRAADLDRLVDQVIAAIDALGVPAPTPGQRRAAPVLTQRELAVLELLGQGATNREIAATLYISPSTAGVHVSNVLRKLGAKRRVDAAGIAHELGLLGERASRSPSSSSLG